VDPGHGGSRTIPNGSTWNNAVGPNGTLEKNLTLDVGLRLHQELKDAGHDVRLTRTQDVNLRLRDRAKVARDFRADAFVSIHFNGSTGHNAQGTETLVHTNHSSTSARLSLDVQDAVLPITGLTDRNKKFNSATRIKPQALGVLRPDFHYPSTAACLVEVSFLDRSDEEQRLQKPTYRQNIAKAIAVGIEAHTGEAMASVPQDAIEAGDAIELAAAESPGSPDVVTWLGLNTVRVEMSPAPEKGTADTNEVIAKPSGMFSRAFVENSGPPLALIANEPNWADLGDFVRLIEDLKLRHFTPDEFLYLGASNKSGKCKAQNTYPPKPLWKNITNTALMLDAIRQELGAPIRILSCYRSPEYNACIKGEDKSLHMRFNAIDFTCFEGTPEIWRRVADRLRSSEKRFVGGIGVYPTRRFVHIDTRGKAANWKGK
jgi:N-acetylmuramoyl-L-alanine amidase